MQEWNERLFFLINGGLASEALDPVFLALSWLGEWAVALPVVAVLWRVDRRRLLLRHLPVLAAGALALALATQAAKDHFAAERPLQHFEAEIRRGEVRVRTPDGEALRQRSLPSGHAVTAFFFLTYLSLACRAHALWALPLAGAIAVSRVYLGAHFPLDVAAGAGLGVVIAGCACGASALRLPRPAPR